MGNTPALCNVESLKARNFFDQTLATQYLLRHDVVWFGNSHRFSDYPEKQEIVLRSYVCCIVSAGFVKVLIANVKSMLPCIKFD